MRQISSSSLDAKFNRASGPPALNEQRVLVLRESVAEHPRCRRWMQSRRCCTGAAPSECAAWRAPNAGCRPRHARPSARAVAPAAGSACATQRRGAQRAIHARLASGGESGFDACKKVKGPQASLARRYAGLAAGGHWHGRQCARARRRAGRGGAGLVSVPRTHLSSRREAANLVSRQSTNETRWAWIDSRWSAAWLMSALDGDEGQVPERS